MRMLVAHGYRCIAYDRRGFGRSNKPWNGHHYDNFGEDVASLLDALDLTDVVLIGCCMGGGGRPDPIRRSARRRTRR
jgi:pimeloyl-ACP methyl ester carboxylesterase